MFPTIPRRVALLGALVAATLTLAPTASADPLGSPVQLTQTGSPGDLAEIVMFPTVVARQGATGPASMVFFNAGKEDADSGTFDGRIEWRGLDAAGDPTGVSGTIDGAESRTNDPYEVDFNPVGAGYDAVNDTYLVVWTTSDDATILAQRVRGSDGARLGTITEVTGAGYSDLETVSASYSPQAGRWLVSWKGAVSGVQRAWAQLLDTDAQPVGGNFRVSAPAAEEVNDAQDLAYDPVGQRWLQVWRGTNSALTTTAGEYEVFAQLIATDGTLDGPNVRISSNGPDGNTAFEPQPPSVAFDTVDRRWLIAWSGPTVVESGEREAWFRRMNADLTPVDPAGVRLTNMGVDGSPSGEANRPRVAFDPNARQFEVVFHGRTSNAVPREVFSQRLDAVTGERVGPRFQLSDTLPEVTAVQAVRPTIAYLPQTCDFQAVWFRQDDRGLDQRVTDFEVFGRKLSSPACPPPPAPPTPPVPPADPPAPPAAPPVTLPSFTPFAVTATATGTQRLSARRTVALRVRCTTACRVSATATLRIGTAKAQRLTSVRARTLTAPATVRVTLSRTQAARVREALRKGTRATLRVVVRAQPSSGGPAQTRTLTIRLRR